MLANDGKLVKDASQVPFFVLNAYLFLYSTDQNGLTITFKYLILPRIT